MRPYKKLSRVCDSTEIINRTIVTLLIDATFSSYQPIILTDNEQTLNNSNYSTILDNQSGTLNLLTT